MLRSSVLRASSSASSILTPSATRHTLLTQKSSPTTCLTARLSQQSRQAHAISNPTLAQIEKRWEAMPPQEQAELWMQLRDRMKVDWHEMTMNEKKAAYWIAFGPHGPRALPPPGENWKVARYTAYALGVAFVIEVILQMLANDAPKTMNEEYQLATNEYLKKQKTEPISGISSEGYTGKGMVQSGPKRN
ncbi:MAG: Cytochrome c oxidase subunit 5A [Candelina submexicana]|nr:MAG: Cytochrome c oxidase subunit 5A [Candelina submexicana]